MRIVERPQFAARDGALNAGLECRRLGDAPGEPRQGRKSQCHYGLRSAAPLRIALLRASTRRPLLLWKNRFTSWLSIAETLMTTGLLPAADPAFAEIMLWRPWLMRAGRIISFWCTKAN